MVLPTVNEVPADFPATELWRFRLASLGTQLVVWATRAGLRGVDRPPAAPLGRGGLVYRDRVSWSATRAHLQLVSAADVTAVVHRRVQSVAGDSDRRVRRRCPRPARGGRRAPRRRSWPMRRRLGRCPRATRGGFSCGARLRQPAARASRDRAAGFRCPGRPAPGPVRYTFVPESGLRLTWTMPAG